MVNKGYTISELKEKIKDKKFNINAIYKNNEGEYFTLLTKAAEQNNFELVKFLIANGANVNGICYRTENFTHS